MSNIDKKLDEGVHTHIDPFDFVEPCEPYCSEVRHAYHQGQWDLAGKINKYWGLNPHPTEHMSCETTNSLETQKKEAYKKGYIDGTIDQINNK